MELSMINPYDTPYQVFWRYQGKCRSLQPPFFLQRRERGGEVEPPTKFIKKGGLAGPQLLEGGDFFKGTWGCHCHIKNKLKSEK